MRMSDTRQLDDDAVVIYDREEPETWLQSDFAVEIGA